MKKACAKLNILLRILMLAVFLPVVFAMGFATENMADDNVIFHRLISNPVIFVLALVAVGTFSFLTGSYRKAEIASKRDYVIDFALIILFTMLYLVNVSVTKEIVFRIPWDIDVVRGTAETIARKVMLGYNYYYVMYQNNIPIAYILGRIYRIALERLSDPYMAEFVWLQINCVLISIGGYFGCILVKKLTRQLLPVIITFFLYLVLVGISPWKIAPYTDTYGIVFPIMCIYFYFCYKDAPKPVFKYFFLGLSLFCGMTGGYIKASGYIVVIAVLGVEFIQFCSNCRVQWKYVLTAVLLTMILAYSQKICTSGIIEEIGLDYNKEVEGSWHHYFYMGLNEYSLGGYDSGAVAMFGEFQFSKSDRNKAEIERAAALIKERGIGGNLYFWLKKMVKTFNDGTFGWVSEVWVGEYFPYDFASNTVWTERLRKVFWEETYEAQVYEVFTYFVWILCVLGFPGVCLYRGEKKERYLILIVSFLGIFFYQMFFEARARYLFVFMPLLIAISVCGLQQYAICLGDMWQKQKEKWMQSVNEGVAEED